MSGPDTVKVHPLRKTKAQLVEEMESLRLRNAELEDVATAHELQGQALRENEERLDLIMNAVPAGISYFDKDQRFRFANHNYKILLR